MHRPQEQLERRKQDGWEPNQNCRSDDTHRRQAVACVYHALCGLEIDYARPHRVHDGRESSAILEGARPCTRASANADVLFLRIVARPVEEASNAALLALLTRRGKALGVGLSAELIELDELPRETEHKRLVTLLKVIRPYVYQLRASGDIGRQDIVSSGENAAGIWSTE